MPRVQRTRTMCAGTEGRFPTFRAHGGLNNSNQRRRCCSLTTRICACGAAGRLVSMSRRLRWKTAVNLGLASRATCSGLNISWLTQVQAWQNASRQSADTNRTAPQCRLPTTQRNDSKSKLCKGRSVSLCCRHAAAKSVHQGQRGTATKLQFATHAFVHEHHPHLR